VHVKNGEKERAIDDIFMLYDSLKAEMTGRCASQGVRAALRRELRTIMNRRNDQGQFG
jgi:hypothetical protein